jgi:hypothetical protein
MKNLTRIVAVCALLHPASGLRADVTVTVDPSKPWLGYMNVFDLPDDPFTPDAFKFGSAWGIADLVAAFAPSPTNTLTLSPNTIAPPLGLADPYWFRPDGSGNKNMEANLYVELNGGLGGQTITFTGNVAANSLTSAHTVIAFIKDFAPDYSSFVQSTVALTPGDFSISLATIDDPARHVQYGFQMLGENVWAADVAPFGSVTINTNAIPPGDPNVDVDPAKDWLGFMNVFNLPEPDGDGEFVPGVLNALAPAELKAVFAGSTLTLSPYVNPVAELNDEFWYLDNDGIRGNKQMDANMYVQPPNGSLSGQTVNFTGTVESNTLTEGHTAVAFIKEWDNFDVPPVSQTQIELTPGSFNISLPISSDPTNVVQYGFQMIGPNVVPGEEAAFGSVVITSTSFTSAYQTWINSFDFSGFTNPDLTQTGDPENDGKTNLEEFALNDDPTSGAASGRIRARVETVGADQALVLTLPVRGAPVFAGSPAKTATADDVVYTIEGSNNLSAFDQGVSVVTPASEDGLPPMAPGSGWSYRSFRLDGAIGGGTPRGPQGFLRAVIAPAP